jgi:hypothetical protein
MVKQFKPLIKFSLPAPPRQPEDVSLQKLFQLAREDYLHYKAKKMRQHILDQKKKE